MPWLAARSGWVRSVCFVAGPAADHLVQRVLIDRDADLAFEPGNIFSENVLGEAAIERFEGALGLVGSHVEGRHHDIGDAEYDLLRRLRGFRLADGILRRAEDAIHARRRQRPGAPAPLDAAPPSHPPPPSPP